jgi:hypothetical protein
MKAQSVSATDQQIHERAIYLAKQYRALETELIEVLQQVDRLKIYKRVGKNSLFVYATEALGLDKAVAYALITVARKSKDVPELKAALQKNRITLSAASRIVSSLTSDNANELIKFAEKHTRDELDQELAKRNPKSAVRDRMKPVAEELVEVKMTMTRRAFEKMKRVESLEAQKQKSTKWGDISEASYDAYLEKNDPVLKAERSTKRKLKLLPARVEAKVESKIEYPSTKRAPLTAEQKHAVFERDQGCCTHVGLDGKRCNQDRWIEVHHIHPVSRGGTNELSNLTTLCSFHHDLAHQLTLPLEDQVTWLRSPRAGYYSGRLLGSI